MTQKQAWQAPGFKARYAGLQKPGFYDASSQVPLPLARLPARRRLGSRRQPGIWI